MTRPRSFVKLALQDLVEKYRLLPWEIGDFLVAAEAEQGEKMYGLLDVRIHDAQLYDFYRMAMLWSPKERRYKLPWSYYRDAGSDLEVAHMVLARAEHNDWSRDEVRKCLKMIRKAGV